MDIAIREADTKGFSIGDLVVVNDAYLRNLSVQYIQSYDEGDDTYRCRSITDYVQPGNYRVSSLSHPTLQSILEFLEFKINPASYDIASNDCCTVITYKLRGSDNEMGVASIAFKGKPSVSELFRLSESTTVDGWFYPAWIGLVDLAAKQGLIGADEDARHEFVYIDFIDEADIVTEGIRLETCTVNEFVDRAKEIQIWDMVSRIKSKNNRIWIGKQYE